MKNIYFPDETISENDLYYVCYMIERVSRRLRQRNRYTVNRLQGDALRRQLSLANVTHCENPLKVEQDWIDTYALESGSFDITSVNPKYTTTIPSATQAGKVYKRLISDTLLPDEDYAEAIVRVYNHPICEIIDDYNTSAYYEPSYVIARAYNNGSFD